MRRVFRQSHVQAWKSLPAFAELHPANNCSSGPAWAQPMLLLRHLLLLANASAAQCWKHCLKLWG